MIVIDGNIGSGKTTQLDLLEKKGFRVRREPLDKWPLKQFYDDPQRWAFFFHMVLLKTQKPPGKGVIYERSLYSSRYVFWPVLKKQNIVTEFEDEIYDYFWNKFVWKPDLFIYLSKDPELSFQHIQKRGQPGDTEITLEYLRELDTEYKKLVMNIPCKVIVVNANRSPDKIHEEICRHIAENEPLLSGNTLWKEVQENGSPRREVHCTSFEHMCSVS
jgi:deoxyadenosine/deoxycytidine kinase